MLLSELLITHARGDADDVRRLAFADVSAKVGESLSALPMIEGQPAPPPAIRGR